MSIREYDVARGDSTLHMIRFGEGPRPLVILPGVTLRGLAGAGEGVAAAYRAFHDRYSVCLVDYRRSLAPGTGAAALAEDVCAVLDREGIPKADFYGVSLGGMVAQGIAAAHPERVRRLAVCSSQCRSTPLVKLVAERWIALARARDIPGLNRAFFADVYSPAYLDTVKAQLPFLEKQGTASDCTRFAVLMQICADFDITGQTHAIRCPALVLGGTEDRVIGPDGPRGIAAQLRCPLRLYPGDSHAVYDEDPQVKEALRTFLEMPMAQEKL